MHHRIDNYYLNPRKTSWLLWNNDLDDETLISGATAELDEAGYSSVVTLCCHLEMTIYAERLVTHLGFVVCNEGSLQGAVAWYYCKNQTRSFAELVEEVIAAADGECAWVGTESKCPTISDQCPHFPDTTSHRRRNCNYRKSLATATTSAAPSASTTTEAPMTCDTSLATPLNFASSSVTTNNLGGQGPSKSEPLKALVFSNIATYAGASVDLSVTSTGTYTPADSTENGLINGHGQINLQSGTSVELTFRLIDSATGTPVSLPEFYFTFLDMDHSDVHHRERLYVSNFSGHSLKEDINDFEEELLVDGRALFKSQKTGHSWDDPTDPANLQVVSDPDDASITVDQRMRSVMMVFRAVSEFTVTYSVAQDTGTSTQGSNFLFTGESSLIDLCPTI
jgi:hypothetical protein